MTETGITALSVRGEAQLVVSPDLATMDARMSATGGDKAAALRELAARLAAIGDALATLGATERAAPGARMPLSWGTKSVTARPEVDWDADDRRRQTGRVEAVARIGIEARDFELLDRMNAALAAHDALSESDIEWSADPDNPGWPQVRANAIQAAIAKGRDYAAALGGTLIGIEHIADAGLLGGSDARWAGQASARATALGSHEAEQESGSPDVPTLDPVPITLRAVIDARFTASVPPLT